MAKVSLTLTLDTSSPYDLAVRDILKSLPDDASRRDYLVSALLFYSRSPTYLMSLKLQDAYTQVETLADLIQSPKLAEVTDKLNELVSAIDEHLENKVAQAVTRALTGKVFLTSKTEPEPVDTNEYVDADDLFNSLLADA